MRQEEEILCSLVKRKKKERKSALFEEVGILDEMSKPIMTAMLHHFSPSFIRRIAAATLKCSALIDKKPRLIKTAECDRAARVGKVLFLFIFFKLHNGVVLSKLQNSITPVFKNSAVITFAWKTPSDWLRPTRRGGKCAAISATKAAMDLVSSGLGRWNCKSKSKAPVARD